MPVLKKSAPHGDLIIDQGGRTWRGEAPAVALSGLVVAYLGRQSNGPCERFTIFPNARIELIFNFGSPYLTNRRTDEPLRLLEPASLFAPKVVRNDHQCGPVVDWFLVQLTLDGCLTLLGECASDLLQVDRPLQSILGSAADDLFCRLREARSFAERCSVFSGWAIARSTSVRRSSRISALCETSRCAPVRTVREVALRCGVGERRLRGIFVAETGMSPKQWLSIVRAERLWTALHPIARTEPRQWWEYADESHAHRDFKHWTGMTIGQLQAIKILGDGLVNGGPRIVVRSPGCTCDARSTVDAERLVGDTSGSGSTFFHGQKTS